MRRKRIALVAVGLLVVLAGCSGSPGGTGTDPATTGTDAAGDAGTAEYPAGTAQSGIGNASALVAATDRRLATTDYALVQSLEQRGGGESLAVTRRARSSPDAERRRYVFDATGETNRRFVADGTVYFDAVSDGERTTGSEPLERPFAALHEPEMLDGGESLGGILRTGNYTAAGTVERDGRTLVRFELVEADRRRVSGTVTDANGTVLVGSDGVVYDATLRIDLESGRWNQTFRIERLGDVTVERPDWVDGIEESD